MIKNDHILIQKNDQVTTKDEEVAIKDDLTLDRSCKRGRSQMTSDSIRSTLNSSHKHSQALDSSPRQSNETKGNKNNLGYMFFSQPVTLT